MRDKEQKSKRKELGSGFLFFVFFNKRKEDFPGSPVVKNPPANEGDTGSNPGQGTETLMP